MASYKPAELQREEVKHLITQWKIANRFSVSISDEMLVYNEVIHEMEVNGKTPADAVTEIMNDFKLNGFPTPDENQSFKRY